jgi:RecB family exonuclease
LAAAREWLAAQPRDRELLVVAASRRAADELVRSALPGGAAFGWDRSSLDRLAAELARSTLAADGRKPATEINATSVAARAVHLLATAGGLTRLAEVADRPGLPVALARTFAELRMAELRPVDLTALGPEASDLAAIFGRWLAELETLGLADRAAVYEAASTALAARRTLRPVLLLDLRVSAALEARLVAALAERAPVLLATVPAGDDRSRALLEGALGVAAEMRAVSVGGALGALQRNLFDVEAREAPGIDATVAFTRAPGVARECVEIARAVQSRAEAGIPFDEIAVLVHAPGEYAAHVEEALRRAEIPAYFVRGTRRPHPAGRAMLALLACAAERLSARRFAEYLSLAQVPRPGETLRADRFVPARDDLLPARVAELAAAGADGTTAQEQSSEAADPGSAPDAPAPWRWDRLLTDAAVIGGRDRWRRRLETLDRELVLQISQLDDGDDSRAIALERRRRDLEGLAAFALPVIDRLADLPEVASWGEWIGHLAALARAALREPEPLLELFTELEPSAPVGNVELEELRIVLAPRLRELPVPPPLRRHGAVFIGTPESARGLAFDTVFVPGLADRIFPGKIVEDPLLRDALRSALGEGSLATQTDRVAAEQLALRLAVGAARERVVLSYPHVDVEQARPRVPSFYLLEAWRAVEGRLVGFAELAAEASASRAGRLGWPAPDDPDDAIDDAEYDLALLAPLIGEDHDRTAGTARYLLGTNPHLARALRARGRRWLSAWTPADGLVDPTEEALRALARHQLDARSYSPTALQNFADCPYKFFLQALMRLAPAEEAAAIEVLDPLTRGALFHAAQFEVLSALRDRGWLPVKTAPLADVLAIADQCLDRVAEEERDRLAPPIDRVWEDAVAALRADLRHWLRREAEEGGVWTPHRFELTFGVRDRDRRYADPASVPDAIPLPQGLRLRGSIDLVERDAAGRLRVTDHKTGKARAPEGVVVGGGTVLQPVLYALAAAELLRAPVESGRLYYCTAQGGYSERVVPIGETAHAAAAEVAAIIGRALRDGFLPAAPRERTCEWCDYRTVCGPYEAIRVKRKRPARLADLERLRGLE